MSVLTEQAQTALLSLHGNATRMAGNFELERIDRALDEIVRLNSSDSHGRQVRSAMANALKVITGRRKTVSRFSLETRDIDPAAAGDPTQLIDLRLWLRGTRRITEQQRRLLMLLADGYDADALAAMDQVPLPRMREQIARARKAARAAHALDTSSC
jgi:hypothetical protein